MRPQSGYEDAREAFRQEALASWAHFRQTGEHLTAEEIRAWLASWDTEDERPAPACHD